MKIKNKKKVLIVTVGIVLILIAGAGIFRNKKNKNKEAPLSISLEKKDITNAISTSGIVESDEKVNVYTNVDIPISEVLVSVGDKVKKGDILAVLDTSSLKDDLKESKLTYKGSFESLQEVKKENKDNIINTKTSLEGSRIALSQQELQTKNTEEILKELELESTFDSKSLDHTIKELKFIVSNKEDSLSKVSENENKLKKNLEKFDDSEFKEESIEKFILLRRKKAELIELDKEIKKAKKKPIIFEEYNYNNMIEDARRDLKKKLEEISRGENKYRGLKSEYKRIISKSDFLDKKKNRISEVKDRVPEGKDRNPEEQARILEEQTRISEEKARISEEKARVLEEKTRVLEKTEEQREIIANLNSELNDLIFNIKRAEENLKNAKKEFSRSNEDLKIAGINDLERSYKQVKHEVEDLEREYSNLTSKLNKAKKKQLEIHLDEYEKLQMNTKDMEYELVLAMNNYEKLLIEKEKAIEDHIKNNKNELTAAKRSFLDSQKQLEESGNNLENSKNALEQARSKNVSTANNQIDRLNVERLESKIENGKIISTSDGVVTEVKAEVGAVPSDILFVIEDMENIHVKAKVKEHNLGLINLDQKVNITTVASEDEIFNGKVIYIGPRSITQSDSPSVEFEIFAKSINIDPKIKLGMNAFLNIVIESNKNVFVVPLNAVVKEDTDSYIYTIEGEKIPVDLGITTKSEVEIKSNLLKEGLEVRIDKNELYSGEASDEGK